MSTPGRSFPANTRYALELEGVLCGQIRSVRGGVPIAGGGSHPVFGHPAPRYTAPPNFEDIEIECGAGMSLTFFDWLKSALRGVSAQKNGSIIMTGYDNRERERLEFTHAAVTEISFPACDLSSSSSVCLALRFKPQTIQRKPGNNSLLAARFMQIGWTANHFSFSIPGLDCSKVSKVNALRIRNRSNDCEESPNLVVTIPEASAGQFYVWQEHAAKRVSAGEKTATLKYLSPGSREIFALKFSDVEILRLSQDAPGFGGAFRCVKMEMDTNGVDLQYSPAAWV